MTWTRRTFLSRGSLGLAIAGGLAIVPALSTILKTRTKPAGIRLPAESAEPLVAHVRDIESGQIALMVGANRVVIHDAELASRLYATARRR